MFRPDCSGCGITRFIFYLHVPVFVFALLARKDTSSNPSKTTDFSHPPFDF